DEPSIEVGGCQGCTLDHGQVVQVVRTLRLYANASTQQSLIRPADRLARDDHAIPGARQRHRICPHDGGAKRSRSGGPSWPGWPRWPNGSGKASHPWGTSGTRGADGPRWPNSSGRARRPRRPGGAWLSERAERGLTRLAGWAAQDHQAVRLLTE